LEPPPATVLIPPAIKPVMQSKNTEPSVISKSFSYSKAALHTAGCQGLSGKQRVTQT
jgi:hypothetical protein